MKKLKFLKNIKLRKSSLKNPLNRILFIATMAVIGVSILLKTLLPYNNNSAKMPL